MSSDLSFGPLSACKVATPANCAAPKRPSPGEFGPPILSKLASLWYPCQLKKALIISPFS